MSIYDAASEAATAAHRSEVEGSGAWQRGQAQAKATEVMNAQIAFRTELDNLKRATVTCDANTPGRDKYDRTYNRVVKAAQRVYINTGAPVHIPKYIPAPEAKPEEADTVAIGAPVTPDPLLTPLGKVAKPTGMGPDGKGIERAIPGSAADNGWADL